MLKKLRTRFVCINMAFLMGMLCIILGLVVHFTRASLESESLRMMQTASARPFEPGRPVHGPDDLRLPCFTIRLDREGRPFTADSGYYDLSEVDLHTLVQAALAAGKPSGILEGHDLRFLITGGPVQGKCLVFADVSRERATMAHLTQTCILAGCLGFGAFLLISLFLARWAVRPAERAWAQQKQFVADASHELKTPLTVIMTNAELLQGTPDGPSQQLASHILTMAHQMRGLVEGLLELARADDGTAALVFSELDLSQLVSDAILPFEALFFEKGLSLTEQIDSKIRVKGSPAHLRQVTEILLDNAQKYAAPDGGEVTVTLRRRGRSHCLLSVSDPGEPIPQKELKNIFKRFYRLDPARALDHSYGLGLSIAQTIVTAHRGRIWAESSEGRNSFFVELPT